MPSLGLVCTYAVHTIKFRTTPELVRYRLMYALSHFGRVIIPSKATLDIDYRPPSVCL